MKKMLICCGVLCVTLLLFCGSAFAAGLTVTTTKSDATVEVTVNDAGTEITVNKTSGVDADNLYLVMVQEGTAAPDSQNLYYLNVEKQSANAFEPMKAYPKDGFMTAGKTYTVYLSDYSGSSNGARKAVATLTVSGDNPDDPTGTILYGDVNGNGTVEQRDLTALARYLAKRQDYQEGGSNAINVSNADCNGNGTVEQRDLTSLARHLAKRSDYAVLPH